VSVIHGDCLEVMATLDAESIDAVVTDPPYDLLSTGARRGSRRVDSPDSPAGRQSGGFMGKAWDGTGIAFRPETWEAALRVAKPGAYLLAFGGTRTVHRMTCAIEDAGWIIRDMLVWIYASGFPKGRANLKPAWEPIVMARKPGPLRDLNIDACRIGTEGIGYVQPRPTSDADGFSWSKGEHVPFHYSRTGEASASTRYTERGGTNLAALPGPRGGDLAGRWPANVILTETPDGGGIFDGGWDGVVGGGESAPRGNIAPTKRNVVTDGWGHIGGGPDGPIDPGDSGTYSRFFLIPKAARSDREPVLGGLPERAFGFSGGAAAAAARGEAYDLGGMNKVTHRANVHPTVKPTELMRHLVRLVTPPGGIVLDPFLGSGTTALAAEQEGFAWIGIEKEAEYVAIAEARLNGTQKGMAL